MLFVTRYDGPDQNPATAALHAGFKPFAMLLVEADKALRVRQPGIGNQARQCRRRQLTQQFIFRRKIGRGHGQPETGDKERTEKG